MLNAARFFAPLATLGFGFIVACGSSDPSTSSPSSSKQESAATKPEVCVEKNAVANNKGVGAYCDKDNTRCESGFVCTADFDAPEGSWFCTVPCSDDSDCGSGAHCFAEKRGKGCVLDRCGDQ